MGDQPLLVCDDVSKHFGGVKALDGIDLVVERGSILGIIGPNGSGKTTLLNVISGIYKPTRGTIIFDGRDITGLPAHQVSKVGIARTYQNIRLFRNLPCDENVLVGLHNRETWWKPNRSARAHALDMLDFVGLLAKRKTVARNLPYGEQRKLEVARALAADPDILLLDEPAAGMGGKESADLVQLCKRINEMGKTLLVIDHNMKVIMNLVQKVIVLDTGMKIKEGLPQEIQADEQVQAIYLGAARC